MLQFLLQPHLSIMETLEGNKMSMGEIQHRSGNFEWTVQGMNILIGGVAFAVTLIHLHNLNSYPDIPLVILSTSGSFTRWKAGFSGAAVIFLYLDKKNNNNQTNTAPRPGSRESLWVTMCPLKDSAGYWGGCFARWVKKGMLMTAVVFGRCSVCSATASYLWQECKLQVI